MRGLRRLLLLMLTVAFAQLGALAAAPAHAHGAATPHGASAADALFDHAHAHHAEVHLTLGEFLGLDHHDGQPSGDEPNPSSDGLAPHTHGCPQFVSTVANGADLILTMTVTPVLVGADAGAVRNTSAPLLRPPSSLL